MVKQKCLYLTYDKYLIIEKMFMHVHILFLLLGVLNCFHCPYNMEQKILANRLLGCKDKLGQIEDIHSILACAGISIAALEFGNVTQKAIPKSGPCTSEFDEYLESLFKLQYYSSRANELRKRFLTPELNLKARALIDKSIREQINFCANPAAYRNEEIERTITLRRISYEGVEFSMYVISSGDFVSSYIINSGHWEDGQTKQLNRVLSQYMQVHNITKKSAVTFLDIGANIGWYTIALGAIGYKVIAVEPTKENIYIIRKNFCLNPSIKGLLLDIAVGNFEKNCSIYSEPFNRGNSVVFCENVEYKGTKEYRGVVRIMKLDTFADFFEHVKALKIDVEGFEPLVLEGGREVFIDLKIPFIQAEFQPSEIYLRKGNPWYFLGNLSDAGYSISRSAFEAGGMTREQMMNAGSYPQLVDLFMLHKDAWKIN